MTAAMTIPPDPTLDGLLAALLRAPTDATLIAIIADRLEETGHPAAAWWRRVKRLGTPGNGTTPRTPRPLWLDSGYSWPNLIWLFQDDDYHCPGIRDLCQRLDRLYEEQANAASAKPVIGTVARMGGCR